MKSTDDKVEEKVSKVKHGAILLTEDFRDLGTTGAIHVALHRMVKANKLVRLARGIYTKPKFSKLVGDILPSPEIVAKAIAKRDQARIIPTGAYALYALGLSTQIPLNLVYITDGSPRKINIGNRTIQFKKAAPKILELKGKISTLVVQALKEIGKTKLSEQEQRKILEILKKEDVKNLKHDIHLAPQWIAEIMSKAL